MVNKSCLFCGPLALPIREFKHFSVYLFKNQYYLGRLFIKSNRHVEDMADLTQEETAELMVILRESRSAVKRAFKPDLFNYASLGNEVNHFHLHVIPRYTQAVIFDKAEFLDENWGKPPFPYELKFQVGSSTLEKIRKTISDTMQAV